LNSLKLEKLLASAWDYSTTGGYGALENYVRGKSFQKG
jgi:hypothetical protein